MISVCLCTCNGAPYIQEQLRSILVQLAPEDEVVVSDDASTDDTVALVRTLADPRVRILQQPERVGVIQNFEAALQASQGAYIFLADQDDIWVLDKVERVCQLLLEVDLVVHDATVINQTGQTLFPSTFALHHARPGVFKNLWKNSYMGCCMAFRRALLTSALPFPRGIPMHDVWVGCLAEMSGTVRFLPVPLLSYRRHGDNLTALQGKSQRGWWPKISGRAMLIGALLIRIWRMRGLW